VKAESLAKIPQGLDLVGAAALPLVTTTGYQLIANGARVQHGQSVLVTGALGNVGTRGGVLLRNRWGKGSSREFAKNNLSEQRH